MVSVVLPLHPNNKLAVQCLFIVCSRDAAAGAEAGRTTVQGHPAECHQTLLPCVSNGSKREVHAHPRAGLLQTHL